MPTAIKALRFDTIDELRGSTDPLARRVTKAADARRPTGAEGEPPSGYHQRILPHLLPGALLIFDDIAWNDGMARAWDTIAAHPSNALAANLGQCGVCVTAEASPASARPSARGLLRAALRRVRR